MTLIVRKVRDQVRGAQESEYHVLAGERVVAVLTKSRNTRTDTHPWKAHLVLGQGQSEFLGSFYAEDGGKAGALRAVAARV